MTNLPDTLYKQIQEIFRKTPVLLIGSGFSCSYGLPGMGALAEHLANTVANMLTSDIAKNIWEQSKEAIKDNLEEGLNGIQFGTQEHEEIVSAIRIQTAKLIQEETVKAESSIHKMDLGSCHHAPSRLLKRLYMGSPQNAESIHVITTNYDTLIELFCDFAELPLNTGFIGLRWRKLKLNSFSQRDHQSITVTEKGRSRIEYRPRKMVCLYKPHGSINWLETDAEGPIEVLNDVPAPETRSIVVPGPSKYHDAVVNILYDGIRNYMNSALEGASALFCIGFGFNDDHLQSVINKRLEEKMPVIIITRDLTKSTKKLLLDHPHVIALFRQNDGASCHWNGHYFQASKSVWELDVFLKEFLE